MADITLHSSSVAGVTCISNTFIDDFMKDANGEYIKIYLYLLRWSMKKTFDISQLADSFDYTEKDVMRALSYWEKVGLLRLEYSANNELTGIYMAQLPAAETAAMPVISSITPVAYTLPAETVAPSNDTSVAAPEAPAATSVAVTEASATTVATTTAFTKAPVDTTETVTEAPAVADTASEDKPSYSAEQIDAFSKDENIQDLIFVISTYLGKPLSPSNTNTLLFWYDSLNLSVELIEYLVEYCIDNKHTSFHYMDAIARAWHEKGITTVEEAKASSKAQSAVTSAVKKAFGISNRNLIDSEYDYLTKWTKDYSFDIDIICEAGKRTILQTNKPSFKYADSILTSWHNSSVTSLADITALDTAFAASSAASAKSKTSTKASTGKKKPAETFSQRMYDYDELEKILSTK